MSWRDVPLSSVAEIVMGNAPSSIVVNTEGDGVPFLQGSGTFGFKFPTFESWCSAPNKLAQEGDILMSVRAPVGDTNVADREYCIGRGLCAIRASKIDKNYLRYAINYAVESLARVGQGSTIDAVNKSNIEQMLIPLPPLTVQRWIADALSSVDEWIEYELKCLDLHNLFRKLLREKLFGAPDSKKLAVKAFCVTNQGYTFPRKDQLGRAGNTPYIKVSDMNILGNEYEILYSENCVSDEYIEIRRLNKIKESSIIFPRVGASLRTNKKRMVAKDSLMDDNLLAITVKDLDICIPKYLYHWLRGFDISELAHDGPVPSISQKNLLNLEIDLYDISYQADIANTLDLLDGERKIQRQRIREVEDLKSSLLHQLLAGTLQPKASWAAVLRESPQAAP